MNDENEFTNRSPGEVYLAIMDKIGVKIDFSREPHCELPLYQKIKSRREFLPKSEIEYTKNIVMLSEHLLKFCSSSRDFAARKQAANLLNHLASFRGSDIEIPRLALEIKEFLLNHTDSI